MRSECAEPFEAVELELGNLWARSRLARLLCASEESQAKVTAIAQADRTDDGALEENSNCIAHIGRRLWTALPSTHEVPKRKGLASPLDQVNLCGWESSDSQFRFDLTHEG